MKSEWVTFIDNYIASQDHIGSYQKAYPGTSRKTAATKGKLLLARPDIGKKIAELQQRKSSIVETVREQAIREAAQSEVIAEMEVDAVLSKIIKGELEIEKVFFNRQGVPIKIKIKPDHSDILAAVDKFYRRFGAYKDDRLNINDIDVVINIRKADQDL
jgi:hypothetical protein